MAKNYTTDKAKATRIKRWSAVLFVFSAAQLAIQVSVIENFVSAFTFDLAQLDCCFREIQIVLRCDRSVDLGVGLQRHGDSQWSFRYRMLLSRALLSRFVS